MLVEGNRTYHIRIAGKYIRDSNRHIIAEDRSPTHWLVTSHEQRAYR